MNAPAKYTITLKDGTKMTVIFPDGESAEEAEKQMRAHWGSKFESIA